MRHSGLAGNRFVVGVIATIFFIAGMRFTPLGSFVAIYSNPIQVSIFARFSRFKNFFRTIPSLQNTKSMSLIRENTELTILQNENNELQKLLDYKEETNSTIVVAKVIGKPPEELTRAWIINRGSSDGVVEGQAVVGWQSYLIGIVSKVHISSSVITLVQDSQFRIAGMTLSSKQTNGLVQGSFGTGVTITLVPKTDRLEIDDVVVTSGIEEFIPKGLIVGRIQEITTQTNDLFQSAVIARDEFLPSLDFVGVIISDS